MIMIRRVIGQSMLPTYRPGTLLFGWRFKKPKKGDIVIAQYSGQEIVKRVERIEPVGYFLVGDNASRSMDSRTYGFISGQAIKCVVIGSIAL